VLGAIIYNDLYMTWPAGLVDLVLFKNVQLTSSVQQFAPLKILAG
jgi:hypothetical protein